MLVNRSTPACRARIWSSCTTAVLLLISILAAPAAWAHVDPPGSSATGIGISLTALRSDGTTAVLPGTISQCETIYYRATLSWAGTNNAAFEGGAWSLTTPDGVEHDITPLGGLPCVGGTFDDPLSAANGNRGLCAGAPASINSALVPYTVSIGDIVGGSVIATTDLGLAYAHIDTSDTFGVGANTPFPLSVELCDDGLFCNGAEVCDETGTDGPVTGICVDGTAPVCDNGLFCDGLETCDEGTDSCVPGTAPVCDNGLFCDGLETCDEVTDACVPGTAPVCDNGLFCDGLETCDEVTDACAPGTAPVCDNGLFCDGLETCDEDTDACAPGTAPVCDNGLFCDGLETCDEVTDACAPGTAPVCDNGLFCDGLETCDEVTDACAPGTAPVCDNGLFCDGLETCDEDTDACAPGTAPVCDNGLFCDGLETCDEVTDACAPGTAPVCDNGMFCDGTETCDEVTDACAPGTPPDCAALGDECNDGLCDEINDVCYTEPLPPETAPDVCFGDEICRTPGFWGSRGGFEGDGYYKKGQNVTGAMLPLLVCGTLIDNTELGSGKSATEAICIKGGDPRAKMMRMLMSANLNCALGECGVNTTTLIDYCNSACAAEDAGAYSMCQSSLGCFNEGGHINDDGSCVAAGESVCSGTTNSCTDDADCNVLEGQLCVSYESCHDRMACPDLYDDGEINESDVCFEPLGAASSPQKCNAARKNTPYIFDLPGWGTNP